MLAGRYRHTLTQPISQSYQMQVSGSLSVSAGYWSRCCMRRTEWRGGRVFTAKIAGRGSISGLAARKGTRDPVSARSPNHKVPQKRRRAPWSSYDDELLRKLRDADLPFKTIASCLRNRTLSSVQARWVNIAPRDEDGRQLHYRSPRWSAEDDKKHLQLREAGYSLKEMCEHFPGRTIQSLSSRHTRALTKRRKRRGYETSAFWAPQEVESLLHMRNELRLDRATMATRLGRSSRSISAKYHRLMAGKIKPPRLLGVQYTSEEDALIAQMRKGGATLAQIAAQLPKRSLSGVYTRMQKMGLARRLPRLQRESPTGKSKS